MVSFKTVYNCYAGTVLRGKGKSQSPQETREKFILGTSISKPPKEVKTRKTVGDWELDMVVSYRRKSKGVWQLLLSEKQACTWPFRYLTALQNLCS